MPPPISGVIFLSRCHRPALTPCGAGIINLVTCDWRGHIIHVLTGFRGAANDKTAYVYSDLFRRNRELFSKGQRLVTDGIFSNIDCYKHFILCPTQAPTARADKSGYLQWANHELREQRQINEQIIGRIKKWRRMGTMNKLCSAAEAERGFRAACILTNLEQRASDSYLRGMDYFTGFEESRLELAALMMELGAPRVGHEGEEAYADPAGYAADADME